MSDDERELLLLVARLVCRDQNGALTNNRHQLLRLIERIEDASNVKPRPAA